MKISPYLQFNRNCTEAISFYEEAFETKAMIFKYEGGSIVHAELDFGDGYIGLSDTPQSEEKSIFGNGGISISVSLTSVGKVKEVLEKLSAGGQVFGDPEVTEWCECFCTLEDKFGINWSLMCGVEEF